MQNPLVRFLDKVVWENACWTWTGAVDIYGYGVFQVNGKAVKAHRFAYEHQHGPIPEGLVIDHLCRHRACVNPEHLEAVTVQENTLRGYTFQRANSLKTHCPQGHEYAGKNLGVSPKGLRYCKECKRAKSLEYYRRNKGER